MKKTISTLLLTALCLISTISKAELLPTEPWHMIALMDYNSEYRYWTEDIHIELTGTYSEEDSLMVVNSIHELNKLCEAITLEIGGGDTNLVLNFNSSSDNFRRIQTPTIIWSPRYGDISHGSILLYSDEVPSTDLQNYITNSLIRGLHPNMIDPYFTYRRGRKIIDKPNSILLQGTYKKINNVSTLIQKSYISEPSSYDKKLIKAVYSSNFKKRLEIAKNQFLPIPRWVKENIFKIAILPLIILLFIFLRLLIVLYKRVGYKIKKESTLFNTFASLTLLIVSSLITIYYITSKNIDDPYLSFYQTIDGIGAVIASTILGLISLNLIRVAELSIFRSKQNKYIKSFYIFLSIILFPTIIYTSLEIITPVQLVDNDQVIRSFLVLIFIGLTRALISFFKFKEKEMRA